MGISTVVFQKKKNQRQLPPDPPAHAHASYHKFMKYASEKNIDLSPALSLSLSLSPLSLFRAL